METQEIEVRERTCPHCGQRLVPRVLDIPLKGGTLTRQFGWWDCQCAGAVVEREEAERRARATRAASVEGERARMLEEAGIPRRYWDARVGDALPEWAPGGAWLWGPPGHGKTYQACAVGVAQLRRGRRVRFSTMLSLSSRMRATWGQRGRSEEDALAPLVSCDLLIIDDLGTERLEGRVLEEMFRLVDGRYGHEGATIVTSNWRPSELAQRIAEGSDDVMAEKVVARLVEMCPPVEWHYHDRRLG